MLITSLTNQKIKNWQKLKQKKYRELAPEFLIEGKHLLEAALALNIVKHIITTEEFQDIYQADVIVTEAVFQKLALTMSGAEVIAVCRYYESEVKDLSHVLILDNIQDPGNVGSIIRSAVAFGFDEIFFNLGVDKYHPKLLRAAQGANFKINITSGDVSQYIEKLANLDFEIYLTKGTALDSYLDIKIPKKLALVFGNEGQGVSETVSNLVASAIKIPIVRVESLNVASAAAILLAHFKKGV